MREKLLAGRVREWAKNRGYLYLRIENMVGEGIPDVWLGIRDWYCWVELKTGTGLRPSQVNWMLLAEKSAVRCCALKMKDSGVCEILKPTWENPKEKVGSFPDLASAMEYIVNEL